MTRHVTKRCRHCEVTYPYQTSGPPVNWYENQSPSDRYCKDCWAVIKEALSQVPIRVKQEYMVVGDPEVIQEVLDQERELKENPPKFLGMPIREVGSPLFKLDDKGRMRVSSRTIPVRLDGVRFIIDRSYDGKPDVIRRPMEVDVETGRIKGPWKDYE